MRRYCCYFSNSHSLHTHYRFIKKEVYSSGPAHAGMFISHAVVFVVFLYIFLREFYLRVSIKLLHFCEQFYLCLNLLRFSEHFTLVFIKIYFKFRSMEQHREIQFISGSAKQSRRFKYISSFARWSSIKKYNLFRVPPNKAGGFKYIFEPYVFIYDNGKLNNNS